MTEVMKKEEPSVVSIFMGAQCRSKSGYPYRFIESNTLQLYGEVLKATSHTISKKSPFINEVIPNKCVLTGYFGLFLEIFLRNIGYFISLGLF